MAVVAVVKCERFSTFYSYLKVKWSMKFLKNIFISLLFYIVMVMAVIYIAAVKEKKLRW